MVRAKYVIRVNDLMSAGRARIVRRSVNAFHVEVYRGILGWIASIPLNSLETREWEPIDLSEWVWMIADIADLCVLTQLVDFPFVCSSERYVMDFSIRGSKELTPHSLHQVPHMSQAEE